MNNKHIGTQSYLDEQRTVLAFHHIPKCGGIALGYYMAQNFPYSWDVDISFSRVYTDITHKKLPNRVFLFSHNAFGVHEILAEDDRLCYYFTVLRNPMSRFLSDFRFEKTSFEIPLNFPIDKFLEEKADYYIKNFGNSLEAAIDRLEYVYDFCGILEDFGTTVSLLSSLYGISVSDFTRLNTTTERFRGELLTAAEREYVENNFEKLNGADIELYNRAREGLKKRAARAGSTTVHIKTHFSPGKDTIQTVWNTINSLNEMSALQACPEKFIEFIASNIPPDTPLSVWLLGRLYIQYLQLNNAPGFFQHMKMFLSGFNMRYIRIPERISDEQAAEILKHAHLMLRVPHRHPSSIVRTIVSHYRKMLPKLMTHLGTNHTDGDLRKLNKAAAQLFLELAAEYGSETSTVQSSESFLRMLHEYLATHIPRFWATLRSSHVALYCVKADTDVIPQFVTSDAESRIKMILHEQPENAAEILGLMPQGLPDVKELHRAEIDTIVIVTDTFEEEAYHRLTKKYLTDIRVISLFDGIPYPGPYEYPQNNVGDVKP